MLEVYVVKRHKLNAVQRSKREPPKAAGSLNTVMVCGAMLVATNVVRSKFTLCLDIVRPRNHAGRQEQAKVSCLHHVQCFEMFTGFKGAGLAPNIQ